MDSITHLSQKLLQERARNGTQPQQPQPPAPPPEMAPPPPYSESDSDADDDDDDDEDSEHPGSPPIKLLINSAHSIQGSNNLVPTSPTPLSDATRFSSLLIHAVNQINNANLVANATVDGVTGRRRPMKLDLTINCGITIIGDRNVVGNVGLRPKTTPSTVDTEASAAAVAGAKRKAEDSSDAEGEAAAKKIALDDGRE